MLYNNLVLLALVASSSALPTGFKSLDAREPSPSPEELIALFERDPGLWDTVKSGWNAVTSPKADAIAKTCQAGAIWTGIACVSQLAPSGPAKTIGLGVAAVGGATTTQDAASKWTKIYKDGKKKEGDLEAGPEEHLLPEAPRPPTPNSGNTSPGSSQFVTPNQSPSNSRPGTPRPASRRRRAAEAEVEVESEWEEFH